MKRSRWATGPSLDLAQMLRYCTTFAEFWKVTEGLVKGAIPKMAKSQVDHTADRELIEIGVLWENTAKSGLTYWNGSLEDGRKIVVFTNTKQNHPSAPTHRILVNTYTEEEMKILAEESAINSADRKAKAEAYKAERESQAARPAPERDEQAEPQEQVSLPM